MDKVYLEVTPKELPGYRYPLCVQIPEQMAEKEHRLVLKKDFTVKMPVEVKFLIRSGESGGPLPALLCVRVAGEDSGFYYYNFIITDGEMTVTLPQDLLGISVIPIAPPYYAQYYVEDLFQGLERKPGKRLPQKTVTISLYSSPFSLRSDIEIVVEGKPAEVLGLPHLVGRVSSTSDCGFGCEIPGPLSFYSCYARSTNWLASLPLTHGYVYLPRSRTARGTHPEYRVFYKWQYAHRAYVHICDLPRAQALTEWGEVVGACRIPEQCIETSLRDLKKFFPDQDTERMRKLLQGLQQLPLSGGQLWYAAAGWRLEGLERYDLTVNTDYNFTGITCSVDYITLLEILAEVFTDVHMGLADSRQRCAYYRAHWDIGWMLTRYLRRKYFDYMFHIWARAVKMAKEKYTKPEFIKRLEKLEKIIERKDELRRQIHALAPVGGEGPCVLRVEKVIKNETQDTSEDEE
jgi:hypothetical protein